MLAIVQQLRTGAGSGNCADRSSSSIRETIVQAKRSSGYGLLKTMFTVSIDEAKMLEIFRRLADAVQPDRIILFGSRARGDAGPDSDLDLLIVKDSDVPRHWRTIPAYNALAGLGIPTDIIWRTPAEIVEWSRVPNHVASPRQ